ncbi:YgeY family selenium metabolism-linked hydrolase [Planctomycetota bacterium]
MNEKIKQKAESYRSDVVNFLREIIAIPSAVGQEGPVIERIKKQMEQLGYDDIKVDPLGNLLGRVGSGKRILAFDGHCDTVDVGNRKLWKVDPFKGDLRDGIIFGRGASDQKGGVAAAVYAGKILKDIGVPDDITVWVVVSVLEEGYEGFNWEYIIQEDKIVPHAVILTEPSKLQISIGHKGRADLQLQTEGVSSHGSRPDLGDNAIYKMTPIIEQIEQLNALLPGSDLLGKASITVTDISSSSPNLNAVPDSAQIFIDRRLTEGETIADAIEQLQNLPSVKQANAQVQVAQFEVKSYTGLTSKTQSSYNTWLMDQDHPLVQSAVKTYEELFNDKAELRTWDFCTNGVATKGKYDIPTIGFGPGDDKFAHTPDDQVPVDHLVKAMAFYATLAYQWNV